MIIVAGSILALFVGFLVFRKPRNQIMFLTNALIYELKFTLMGATEIVKDHVYARYNKTGKKTKTNENH